jgi:hypothetical protein
VAADAGDQAAGDDGEVGEAEPQAQLAQRVGDRHVGRLAVGSRLRREAERPAPGRLGDGQAALDMREAR